MNFRSYVALAFIFAHCTVLSSLAVAADDRPNILFIITDQQHAGLMSAAGDPYLKTPALDSLARDGVRFRNAYAANPVCVPSRIALATGVMPGRFGSFNNDTQARIPDEVAANSLGKLMKRAGYATFYGGKTSRVSGLESGDAGYDEFFAGQRDALVGAAINFVKRQRDDSSDPDDRDDGDTAEHPNKPFFVVTSFVNPHDICFAYSAYFLLPNSEPLVDKLYSKASALPLDRLPLLPHNYSIPADEPPAVESNLRSDSITPTRIIRRGYSDHEWRKYRWIYRRLAERVDRQIGRLLDFLERSGLDDNTLVVFTSDHGEMDGAHRLASKGQFYEESAGVPLLMRLPGAIAPGVVNDADLVNTGLDLLPTFLDYAGEGPRPQLLGRSLRPVAEEREGPDRRPYVVSENELGRMVRSGRYKYCVYVDGQDRESLVDLVSDPGELKNLASLPEYAEVLDLHRGYLRQWIEESGDTEAETFAVGLK